MYQCHCCGAEFEEPAVLRYNEYHGEFRERWLVYICPECGDEEIEEVVENAEDK